MSNEPFIQCENLIKIYRINDKRESSDASLEVQALQGLDLAVSEGEMIGVVGASGSGKSTLLNILGGLDRPDGGRAMVDKQDLGKLSQHGLDQYRRKTVGFVWQYGARNLSAHGVAPNWVSGVSGDVDFEKQQDGRWRSQSLLPDENLVVVPATVGHDEGYTHASADIQIQQPATP